MVHRSRFGLGGPSYSCPSFAATAACNRPYELAKDVPGKPLQACCWPSLDQSVHGGRNAASPHTWCPCGHLFWCLLLLEMCCIGLAEGQESLRGKLLPIEIPRECMPNSISASAWQLCCRYVQGPGMSSDRKLQHQRIEPSSLMDLVGANVQDLATDLETQSGGTVIWRAGGSLLVYRGSYYTTGSSPPF